MNKTDNPSIRVGDVGKTIYAPLCIDRTDYDVLSFGISIDGTEIAGTYEVVDGVLYVKCTLPTPSSPGLYSLMGYCTIGTNKCYGKHITLKVNRNLI